MQPLPCHNVRSNTSYIGAVALTINPSYTRALASTLNPSYAEALALNLNPKPWLHWGACLEGHCRLSGPITHMNPMLLRNRGGAQIEERIFRV